MTPKPNVAAVLYITTAVMMLKTFRTSVLAAVGHWTTSKTTHTSPRGISKVTVTCDFRSECTTFENKIGALYKYDIFFVQNCSNNMHKCSTTSVSIHFKINFGSMHSIFSEYIATVTVKKESIINLLRVKKTISNALENFDECP